MPVPNFKSVVEQVYARGGFDLTSKAGCGRFTEACCVELHATDPQFGHLKKSKSRNHVVDAHGQRHAVDAVLYKATGQSVDLIASSESPSARPAWTVDTPRYSADDWYAPVLPPSDRPDPPKPPAPDLEGRVSDLEAQVERLITWAGSFV